MSLYRRDGDETLTYLSLVVSVTAPMSAFRALLRYGIFRFDFLLRSVSIVCHGMSPVLYVSFKWQIYHMDSRSIDKIKHIANTDVVRRMLVKYFVDKGFTESFDRLLYPALMQDLPIMVPQLATKIDVEPHAVEVDPTTGKAKLGWNLFVLGNQRMYLGETLHRDLVNLARQVQGGSVQTPEAGAIAMKQVTPRQVVNFVTRVLGKHESGYVDLQDCDVTKGRHWATTSSSSAPSFFNRVGY